MSSVSRFLLSSYWVALCQPCLLWHGSGQVWLGTGDILWSQEATPRLLTLRWGWVYCLAPEASLIRGMPTRPKAFLAMPDACGLQPSDQTHLKNCLVPDLYAGTVAFHAFSCWVALRRPCSLRHGSGWVCLSTGDFLRLQPSLQAYTPFWGVVIARQLRCP